MIEVDIGAAEQLLDYDARLRDPRRAREQLEGAVALHNILCRHNVAYLADEVGMGKTLVALGVVALFRHYHPSFRILVIAPRENIQRKWVKEFKNFVKHNVRYPDLRVKAIDEQPARPLVQCDSLADFIRQVSMDRNRDFFLRMSSFSLPLGKESNSWHRIRDDMQATLAWLPSDNFDLRNKDNFKASIAKAICCAMPTFDLVIVDEGHNLKHGYSERTAARNRVLGMSFGRERTTVDPEVFPGYGTRASKVLFLSATPIEESYVHLWNQLDVFGMAAGYDGLKDTNASDEVKKELAARFLIRRVTSIEINKKSYTKNMYRREWRNGGVTAWDEPIQITDDRQRLIIALTQKKVAELLGSERFNQSFQIGMLASFESFLETTKVKRVEDEGGNFDDSEQTDDIVEREGVDVADVNRLARSYKSEFGMEMPHPKMDAIVRSLSESWRHGEKSLIFVRRVASVKELKNKLDESYDSWLIGELRRRLPPIVLGRLEVAVRRYVDEKARMRASFVTKPEDMSAEALAIGRAPQDRGGTDTFFAWFFRGEGPKGLLSGAAVSQRFSDRGGLFSTFFDDNHVAAVLNVRPGQVTSALASILNQDVRGLRDELRRRSVRFLSRAKKITRSDRFEAVQAAAIELLKDRHDTLGVHARAIWHEWYESLAQAQPAADAPEIDDWLEQTTFWTELRARPILRERLWPISTKTDPAQRFREEAFRAHLLAGAARLGHSFIDLYVLVIQQLKTLDPRTKRLDHEGRRLANNLIIGYLDLLEEQMEMARSARIWGVFDELTDIADNYELIVDVNAHEIREKRVVEAARFFGAGLLRQQQPIGGMWGEINQTLVRQFRMPGYPLVLITTDLLQEGEDLHTFCSSVHHYGISWTPSSMEQRTGRIDRVRSLAARRLSALDVDPAGEDKLQIYYPYLQDTVEVLQVQRVLDRMDVFMRLMHEGLGIVERDKPKVDVTQEVQRAIRIPQPTKLPLKSAFSILPGILRGRRARPAIEASLCVEQTQRFKRVRTIGLPGVDIDWENDAPDGVLLGTVRLPKRLQPISLFIQSHGGSMLIRCVSPVGCVGPGTAQNQIRDVAAQYGIRVGAIRTADERSYDVTVEGDVLLGKEVDDAARIAFLVEKVAHDADLLEQELLPGKDEPMIAFRHELQGDTPHGR